MTDTYNDVVIITADVNHDDDVAKITVTLKALSHRIAQVATKSHNPSQDDLISFSISNSTHAYGFKTKQH